MKGRKLLSSHNPVIPSLTLLYVLGWILIFFMEWPKLKNGSASAVRLAALHHAFLSQSTTEEELTTAETRTSWPVVHCAWKLPWAKSGKMYKALVSRGTKEGNSEFPQESSAATQEISEVATSLVLYPNLWSKYNFSYLWHTCFV